MGDTTDIVIEFEAYIGLKPIFKSLDKRGVIFCIITGNAINIISYLINYNNNNN